MFFVFFCRVLHNFPFWGKTCIYLIDIWNLWNIHGMLYVFWFFFCHVLHNFPFWGKTCIYLFISRICEICMECFMFFVFFVMCYIIFHFEAKRVYICWYLESVKYSGMLYGFDCFVMCWIFFHFEAKRVYIWLQIPDAIRYIHVLPQNGKLCNTWQKNKKPKAFHEYFTDSRYKQIYTRFASKWKIM